MSTPLKFVFSGGGTGGHIFPAIAIANVLKERFPDAEFLFIGALGRMEMEKVPAAGYKIEGLPIAGFQRKQIWKNWSLPFKVVQSLNKAKKIIKSFTPDVVIGTGGYASGPTLRVASGNGIPTLIQEQNSFPGVTNKLLASKVSRICVAFPEMERFFPKEKIKVTGNPVRKDILDLSGKREEAIKFFGLKPGCPTLLVIGGSLGARTINESLLHGMKMLEDSGVQVIWQTGKNMEGMILSRVRSAGTSNIHPSAFIQRMDLAYAAADLVVSRAGAISVSEICAAGKACILVPSPNVAEDHQTKNAMALVKTKAAVLIADAEAKDRLIPELLSLMKDDTRLSELRTNALHMGHPRAAEVIADEIIALVNRK